MLNENDFPMEDELSNDELISLIKEKSIDQCVLESNEYAKEKIFKYSKNRGYDIDGDIVLYYGNWFYVNERENIIRKISRNIEIDDPSEYEKFLLKNQNKNIVINKNPSK